MDKTLRYLCSFAAAGRNGRCRLEFAGVPGRAVHIKYYRARCHRMAGNRIAIVTDRPQSAVEVHPASVNSVEMAGATVENYPPGPAMR